VTCDVSLVTCDVRQWERATDGAGCTVWSMRPYPQPAPAAGHDDGGSGDGADSTDDGKVPWIAVDPSQPDLEQVSACSVVSVGVFRLGGGGNLMSHTYGSNRVVQAVPPVPARASPPEAGRGSCRRRAVPAEPVAASRGAAESRRRHSLYSVELVVRYRRCCL
jgi:hypothetical protein